MPFCRCGELCTTNDKCKKCGFNFLSTPVSSRRSSVDRWQSRYLGSVMGLDKLSSPVEEDQNDEPSVCSPLTQRVSSPILKRISTPFSGLLDSRRVTPSKYGGATPQVQRAVVEGGCGECHKKLLGKTVRLPDTQKRYHWDCLKCKGCTSPFEDTSFFIDQYKHVYHPSCAPVTQNCSRCSTAISDTYIALNSLVLHPRCFRCTGCQKVLHPTSIYTDLNGSYCQQCTNEKLSEDKETLSKHIKIVPQLQTNGSAAAATQKLSCSPSLKTDKIRSSPPISPILPAQNNQGTVKPSSLMSSRGRPLPRFGVVRDCPGCSLRIASVHEEIPGPKAARWHKKCLACNGCSKILDSGATVHEEKDTGNLKPWCTTCLLNKRKSTLPSTLSQKFSTLAV